MMKDLNQSYVEVVVRMALNGKSTNAEAASKLGVTVRYVQKMKAKMKANGAGSLAHGNKGRAPKNRSDEHYEAKILGLYREKYEGFNFAHFKDMLEEFEGMSPSYHLVYRILADAGYASPVGQRERKNGKGHPSRPRRSKEGELVQIDASIHHWFGEGLPTYALHGAIDDATGKILALFFDGEETLWGYLNMLRQILVGYGIPEAFYGDNRTVFITRRLDPDGNSSELDTDTQFRRICRQLGTEVITTSVSQAKGRIERAWGTYQSRLLNELRIHGIKTVAEANAYLPGFIKRMNKKFSVDARCPEKAWKKAPTADEINFYLSIQYVRKADSGSCYSLLGRKYQLICPNGLKYIAPKRGEASFYKTFDGRLVAVAGGKQFRIIDAEQPSFGGSSEGPKKEKTPWVPGPTHPWRKFVINYKYTKKK